MERAVELARDPAVSPSWYQYLGKDHARRGMVEETEALLAETRLRMDSTLVLDRASVALVRGELALAQDDPEGALPSLREAYALRETAYNLESLAYGLQAAGELEEARDRYVSLLSQPETGWEAQEYWIYAHLRLARIYEALGDSESALEYDRRFLEIWKEADADLPGLEEARRRVEGSGPTE
jgi:tetratricopeptide (TPR) repeat protein